MTRATTRRSPHARRIVLGVGAALLVAANLAGCGFDTATNRVNAIQTGTTDRDGQVDVLGALIVAGQPESGTFVASLVNNDPEEQATLSSVGGAPDSTIEVPAFDPIEIPAQGTITLGDTGGGSPAEKPGITVRGDFVPGDFVTISLDYDSGETTMVEIPVVPACRQWEGLDSSSDVDSTQTEAAQPELEEPEGSAEPDFPSNGAYYECEPVSEPEE